MWIDYLGYATMHYCQVMVIGFCGAIEFMMMWMIANEGGPLGEAIHDSQLTISAYYVMVGFSAVKGIAGFCVYPSIKREHHWVYGDGMNNDMLGNDSEVRTGYQRYVADVNVRQDFENNLDLRRYFF